MSKPLANPDTPYRPMITYEKTAKMYRKAEGKIETLIGLGFLTLVIGVAAIACFFGVKGLNFDIILSTGIYLTLAGFVQITMFSAAKWFVKATRCRFMIENEHLRDMEVPSV